MCNGKKRCEPAFKKTLSWSFEPNLWQFNMLHIKPVCSIFLWSNCPTLLADPWQSMPLSDVDELSECWTQIKSKCIVVQLHSMVILIPHIYIYNSQHWSIFVKLCIPFAIIINWTSSSEFPTRRSTCPWCSCGTGVQNSKHVWFLGSWWFSATLGWQEVTQVRSPEWKMASNWQLASILLSTEAASKTEHHPCYLVQFHLKKT